MKAKMTSIKAGVRVKMKEKLLDAIRQTKPEELPDYEGPLEVILVEHDAISVKRPGDDKIFVLFDDEVDIYEEVAAPVKPAPTCNCSARDLLFVGHKCGLKAPIDRR